MGIGSARHPPRLSSSSGDLVERQLGRLPQALARTAQFGHAVVEVMRQLLDDAGFLERREIEAIQAALELRRPIRHAPAP